MNRSSLPLLLNLGDTRIRDSGAALLQGPAEGLGTGQEGPTCCFRNACPPQDSPGSRSYVLASNTRDKVDLAERNNKLRWKHTSREK